MNSLQALKHGLSELRKHKYLSTNMFVLYVCHCTCHVWGDLRGDEYTRAYLEQKYKEKIVKLHVGFNFK
jgi:hypothetical protein